MARQSRAARLRGKIAFIAADNTYRVIVRMTPHETVRNLGAFRLDFCCMPQPRSVTSGERTLHAYASGRTIAELRKAGRTVEVLADAKLEGRRMQKLVGKGDRFKGGRLGPAGVGKLV